MHSINKSSSSNHGLSRYADCLATFFPYSQLNESYWIGAWIEVNIHELHEYSNKKCHSYSEVTNQEIRNNFIELIINKICHHSYGAGQVYELYEERKQATLRDLFVCLSLSENEMALIKDRCDYSEDVECFKDPCDECGIDVGALQMAMSLNISGKTLCTNCLVY
jgi:hypothetical protein